MELGVDLFGVSFKNPVLLAAGTCGFGEEVASVIRLDRLGGIVTKSVTLKPRLGNPPPRVWELADGMMNSVGLANPGAHAVRAEKLPWIRDNLPDLPVFLSVAGHTVAEYFEVVEILEGEPGFVAFELNLSCPHMDRKDMGSNIGKDQGLCSVVTEAVKEVATIPVWCKLTPATADIVVEAAACFRGGADAIVSSNTFPSLPLIDPDSLEFEINVDGLVSSGGLGGPAILPLSLAKMAQMTEAFPEKSFSGIGGISDLGQALSYFLLGCGTVQVCTAAMLDQAVGPNIIKRLNDQYQAFLERHESEGWHSLDDFRGARRERVVSQSKIRRPEASEYHAGYEAVEGYAKPQ